MVWSKLIQLQKKKPQLLIFLIIPFQMKTNPENQEIHQCIQCLPRSIYDLEHFEGTRFVELILMLRFREQQVAMSADIEMFMQINVAPFDRAFLRFLLSHNDKIEPYVYTQHIIGATFSPCLASNALRRSARDN